MVTVRADEVRIPRHAREALARHEDVVVLNHERPTYVIVNSEDHAKASRPTPTRRPLREALAILCLAAPPDPSFAEDLEEILGAVGPTPNSPWEPS